MVTGHPEQPTVISAAQFGNELSSSLRIDSHHTSTLCTILKMIDSVITFINMCVLYYNVFHLSRFFWNFIIILYTQASPTVSLQKPKSSSAFSYRLWYRPLKNNSPPKGCFSQGSLHLFCRDRRPRLSVCDIYISAEILFFLPICVIMGIRKASLREGGGPR